MGRIRRIAVTTGGGDAPGLNAVIRSVVLSALQRNWEAVSRMKCVPLDSDTMMTARDLGVCFGDDVDGEEAGS